MTVKKGLLMVIGAGTGLGAVMYARSQNLPTTGAPTEHDEATKLNYYWTGDNCAWYVYEETGGYFGDNGYFEYGNWAIETC